MTAKAKKLAAPSALDELMAQAMKAPPSTKIAEDGAITVLPSPEPAAAAPGPAPIEPANPWDDANPRIISFFQIRMPEPLKKKLEWLHSAQTVYPRESQHAIALAALEHGIDRQIAKVRKEKGG